MIWRRKEPEKKDNLELWDKLMQILKIVEVKIVRLEAKVEQLEFKIRKKLYSSTLSGDEGSDSSFSSSSSDPFDKIRSLKKNIKDDRIGI